MFQWGYYLAVLFVWIGAWNLVDLSVQKYVRRYGYQMLIYACILIIGIVVLVLIDLIRKPQI
jgi:heme/copper-type cytochrome/quinol oxidase subunit 2